MSLSADAYSRQLKQLLPPGAAWTLDPGSVLSQLLTGLAQELARIDGRGDTLIDEMDPRTTVEMLTDWERVLGLPDGCLLQLPNSISERQALVTQKAIGVGGQSIAFFTALAATLGYPITIEELHPMRVGFRCGDRCQGLDWAFVWYVHVSLSAAGGLKVMRAGFRCGDRIRLWGAIDFECIVMRAAPAHTIVLFSYA